MRVELRDSLENLFPDSVVGRRPCEAMQIDVARGGTVAVHVLLNDLPLGAALSASVSAAGREVGSAEWFRLVDVPVEENTGPGGFTEADGAKNPYVVRRAPFRTYDAMAPARLPLKTTAATMALRLHVRIPAAARPGERRFEIDVACGSESRRLRLDVVVHRAVVPPVGAKSFPYTNWYSFERMAEQYAVRPWSEGHWRVIRRYAELMAHGRQNMFWVPLEDVFAVRRGQPVLDATRLRRIVATFTDAGLHFIEGGHFGRRSTTDWECPTFSTAFGKHLATSPEGAAEIACVARQLMAEIERNGWRERWVQHVADEPIAENATDFRLFCGIVRRCMPGIPLLDALGTPDMAGSLDMWCPNNFLYEKERDAYEAHRKNLGDRIWFYVCCCPGGLWLNRLLDQELLRPALMGWAGALYNLDGFLHWGLNYARDPLHVTVVEHTEGRKLPPGDTHIVYPGEGGPWSGLRFESHREGFEDLELFRQLRGHDPKLAVQIARRAVRGFKRYTKSVATFRAARKALLEAVDRGAKRA